MIIRGKPITMSSRRWSLDVLLLGNWPLCPTRSFLPVHGPYSNGKNFSSELQFEIKIWSSCTLSACFFFFFLRKKILHLIMLVLFMKEECSICKVIASYIAHQEHNTNIKIMMMMFTRCKHASLTKGCLKLNLPIKFETHVSLMWI